MAPTWLLSFPSFSPPLVIFLPRISHPRPSYLLSLSLSLCHFPLAYGAKITYGKIESTGRAALITNDRNLNEPATHSQAHSSVVTFRTAAPRRQDLYVLRKLPCASPPQLVSLGRLFTLSKHLINGFIVHFRGLLSMQRIRRRNFTGTYATVNNFFPCGVTANEVDATLRNGK